MKFKKVRMGEEITVETIIRDLDGRKLDKWFVGINSYLDMIKTLNNKYGLGFIIKSKREDADLEWATK